jgi:hypothetical protein
MSLSVRSFRAFRYGGGSPTLAHAMADDFLILIHSC